ncbi:hypothetical protein M0R45_005630 [Rubus argutus]|uniref:Uncharacterized protein n=1 Tax=Rubus argutus TaxID=59490 RepID=A0AAW1YN53_RUBAR
MVSVVVMEIEQRREWAAMVELWDRTQSTGSVREHGEEVEISTDSVGEHGEEAEIVSVLWVLVRWPAAEREEFVYMIAGKEENGAE